MSRNPPDQDASMAFFDGYDALFEENKSGRIIENPYEIGTKEHDNWDFGYQAAADECGRALPTKRTEP